MSAPAPLISDRDGSDVVDIATPSGGVGDVTVTKAPTGAPESAVGGESAVQLGWRRLRRDKVAVTRLGVLIFFVPVAIMADLTWQPQMGPVKWGTADGSGPLDHPGAAPDDAGGLDSASRNSTHHIRIFGVKPYLGRDTFTKVLHRARPALMVLLALVAISIACGGVAGTIGGWSDSIANSVIDYLLALPSLLVVLAVTAVVNTHLDAVGSSSVSQQILIVVVVISVSAWMGTARLVRRQVRSRPESDYLDATPAAGGRPSREMIWQLPNRVDAGRSRVRPPGAALHRFALVRAYSGPWPARLHRQDWLTPSYVSLSGVTNSLAHARHQLVRRRLQDALDPKSSR
jgi:ABC-type dipeptide/oligopeptide/nickel transport system permease subunit